MPRWLRQSTSVDVPIGPFVDATDGVTAESTLSITQADIRLKKNNGNWAQKAAAQTLSHEENGYYEVTLDATDTDTLGLLRVAVNESGAAPVWEDFHVIPDLVYDSWFSATTIPAWGILDYGTAQSATATTIVLRAGVTITNDVIIGATVFVYSSTNGLFERRIINDWDSATDTATVDTWTQTPTGTIKYIVFATAPGSVANPHTVQVVDIVAAALAKFLTVDTGTTSASAVSGSVVQETVDLFGSIANPQVLQQTTIATLASQTDFTLTAGSADDTAYAGCPIIFVDQATSTQKAIGKIDIYTGASKRVQLEANPGVFTVATGDTVYVLSRDPGVPAALPGTTGGVALHESVDTVETALTTANAALVTIDTVVDAIKVKTDQLDFSADGNINANVEEVNETIVDGSGTSGDPWGPA